VPISRRSPLLTVAAAVAMALLLAMGVFYVSSGLLAPLWAVVVLVALWLALVVLGFVWFRSHPVRVMILPVVAAGIWFGALSAGEAWLGWTG
jgi:hypothetical protein